MKKFEIIDAETGDQPTSEEDRCVVKIQLLVAKIIADDVVKIKEISPQLSEDEIIGHLLDNWSQSIKNFTSSMLKSTHRTFRPIMEELNLLHSSISNSN